MFLANANAVAAFLEEPSKSLASGSATLAAQDTHAYLLALVMPDHTTKVPVA